MHFETGLASRPLLLGPSRAARRLLADLQAIGVSDEPVLITGESGTGKELVACALHRLGRRRDRPFVVLDSATMADEVELPIPSGGTLFVDELGDLSPRAQARLVHLLSGKRRDGATAQVDVDCTARLIAATHHDLHALVQAGEFRRDLYHRIKVLDIQLPPLRERREDLPALAAHFLRLHAPDGREVELGPGVWSALERHDFPGNVRELEHALRRALVMAGDEPIECRHLPAEIAETRKPRHDDSVPLLPLREAVSSFERQHVIAALRTTAGRRGEAAKLLGVTRKCVWEKVRAYAIAPSEYEPVVARLDRERGRIAAEPSSRAVPAAGASPAPDQLSG